MRRGGHSRSAIGNRFALMGVWLLAVLSLLVLAATPAAGSPVSTTAAAARTPTTATTATSATSAPTATGATTEQTASWTLDQAEAAVSASTIARLPGAPAVFDEAEVRVAIGNAPIRIALLPFAPTDDTRQAMEQQAYDLNTWGTQQGWPMIVVQGLQVLVSAYDISPGAISDLEPVLAQDDVTHQILRAITVLGQAAAGTSTAPATSAATTQQDGAADPTVLPAQMPADPAEVQRIADALAAKRIYSDPGLSAAQSVDSSWANVGPGLTVRAAILPPVAPGGRLTDLIGPLSQRFPDDVVVVIRGRWIEVAGPDPEILDSAVLWLYGNYMKPFLRWTVQPSQAVGLLAGQIGLLRTGVVSNQQPSATRATPTTPSGSWLPWLLGAAALVLAGVGGWWAGRHRRNAQVAEEEELRAGILGRRRFGARLAGVAGRITELDELARDGVARTEVDAAVEKYRAARDVLIDDGDLALAAGSLDAAERHLASAGRIIGAPTGAGGAQ